MWINQREITKRVMFKVFRSLLSMFGVVLLLLVWVYLLAGCASIGRGLSETDRCRDLEERYEVWGALAIASTGVSGSGVLATPFPEDRDVRLGLAIASASIVAFGAAALFVRDDVLESWGAECDLSFGSAPEEENPKTTITVETSTISR